MRSTREHQRPVADAGVEVGHGGARGVGGGELGERGRIGADAAPRTSARPTASSPSTSRADAANAAGPPRGVEPARDARHRRAQRPRRVVGQHPDRVRAAERRVGEVREAQVGALRRGASRARAPGACPARARRRPSPASSAVASANVRLTGLVAGPRVAPPRVEAGPAGQVEEPVVEEPQRRVRHQVVREPVGVGVEVEQAGAGSRGPARRRLAPRRGRRRSSRRRATPRPGRGAQTRAGAAARSPARRRRVGRRSRRRRPR